MEFLISKFMVLYENMEFNVYIKNHKMHIESKQQNKNECNETLFREK